MIGSSVNIKIKSILINVDILIVPLVLIAVVKNFFIQYLITMAFIMAHELGHIVVAIISGAKVYRLRILPVGLNAVIDDSSCGKYSKIFIYLAGPCISLMFAITIYILYACHFVSKELSVGVFINMWLAFFNLLPILPLDGGKIAMEILSEHFGIYKASKQLHIISLIVAIIIICLGLVVFWKSLYNVSIVLVGIYILLCMKVSKKETAFMNIKNFVFRRSRVIKKGIYPAREIVVMKNVKLSEVIKAIDYANRFHIINVLDDDLRIIKVMTEQEILDALMVNSIDTTIDELLVTPNLKE